MDAMLLLMGSTITNIAILTMKDFNSISIMKISLDAYVIMLFRNMAVVPWISFFLVTILVPVLKKAFNTTKKVLSTYESAL